MIVEEIYEFLQSEIVQSALQIISALAGTTCGVFIFFKKLKNNVKDATNLLDVTNKENAKVYKDSVRKYEESSKTINDLNNTIKLVINELIEVKKSIKRIDNICNAISELSLADPSLVEKGVSEKVCKMLEIESNNSNSELIDNKREEN